jgi:hypothetical protein
MIKKFSLEKNYKQIVFFIIAFAIAIRIFLLFLAPISMFADPVIRYLPAAEKILHLNFNFHDFPLFIIIEAFWMLFLQGKFLWIALKLTSFIFLIAILFLLPSLFKRLNLEKKEQVILLAMFLLSTWSILLSVGIMPEMMLTFFVIALFLSIENYLDKPNKKWIFALIFLTAFMIFTKPTGYILLIGFGLYIFGKKGKPLAKKAKAILWLGLGALTTIFWPIKNYLATGNAFINPAPPPVIFYPLLKYLEFYIYSYHYFWEIPLPSKVGFSGIIAPLYNGYYLATILVTAIISILIIIALLKYGKKYFGYVLLMLPLLGFALLFEPIFFTPASVNIGRYSFPLWIFLFFFLAKFISDFKNKKIRIACYILAALFCILLILSACGIALHMHNVDAQILQIDNVLKRQNATGTFITNDEFTSSALSYYLKQPVIFNLTRNVRDTSVPCSGENIFSSKNFDVFKEGNNYRICRV